MQCFVLFLFLDEEHFQKDLLLSMVVQFIPLLGERRSSQETMSPRRVALPVPFTSIVPGKPWWAVEGTQFM